MSDITTTDPRAEESFAICIVDPGGEDRANVPVTDADHTPAADPDAADQVMAPVADALLGAAGLGPGEAVLDLGCGCGATTLTAARAVGLKGSVCGIDVTEAMLDIARRRIEQDQIKNVTLVHGDAQTYSFPRSFDVAISRFGTMFFTDPAAAFRNIASVLRPGGRLCLATWQPLEVNEWLAVPGASLLRWIMLPDFTDDGPGMFAQSDPDIVTATLERAGYTSIRVDPVTVRLRLGAGSEEAMERLTDTGVGRAALDAVPEAQRPEATAAVQAALADYADAEGVRLRAAIWITTAVAP
jgi:SAM-dependent methyltransferase